MKEWRPSLLGARTLLGAPGLTTNKKLLGAPGIATTGARTLVGWRPSLLGSSLVGQDAEW